MSSGGGRNGRSGRNGRNGNYFNNSNSLHDEAFPTYSRSNVLTLNSSLPRHSQLPFHGRTQPKIPQPRLNNTQPSRKTMPFRNRTVVCGITILTNKPSTRPRISRLDTRGFISTDLNSHCCRCYEFLSTIELQNPVQYYAYLPEPEGSIKLTLYLTLVRSQPSCRDVFCYTPSYARKSLHYTTEIPPSLVYLGTE